MLLWNRGRERGKRGTEETGKQGIQVGEFLREGRVNRHAEPVPVTGLLTASHLL